MPYSDKFLQKIYIAASAAFIALIIVTAAFFFSDQESHESADVSRDLEVLKVADIMGFQKSLLEASGEAVVDGYEIQWSTFSAGPPIIAAATGGSVDIGWMAETPMIFAQASGSPIKVIGVAIPTNPNAANLGLAVAKTSEIQDVSDLKGHKVAVLPGTILHYVLIQWLERAGLALSDIRLVNLMASGTGTVTQLLADGSIDAAVMLDPLLTKSLEQNEIRLIAGPDEEISSGMRYLVVADEFLSKDNSRLLVEDYLSRVIRSYQWQQHEPDLAAAHLSRQYGLEQEQAEKVLANGRSRFVPIKDNIIQRHQKEADTFHRLGLIQKSLDTTEIFDTRFNTLVARLGTDGEIQSE